MASARFDVGRQIESAMVWLVSSAMKEHTCRKGCLFTPDALAQILRSKAFKAAIEAMRGLPEVKELGDEVEKYEMGCLEKAA